MASRTIVSRPETLSGFMVACSMNSSSSPPACKAQAPARREVASSASCAFWAPALFAQGSARDQCKSSSPLHEHPANAAVCLCSAANNRQHSVSPVISQFAIKENAGLGFVPPSWTGGAMTRVRCASRPHRAAGGDFLEHLKIWPSLSLAETVWPGTFGPGGRSSHALAQFRSPAPDHGGKPGFVPGFHFFNRRGCRFRWRDAPWWPRRAPRRASHGRRSGRPRQLPGFPHRASWPGRGRRDL